MEHRLYVYYDWLPIVELDALNEGEPSIVQKHTWGLDLAGQAGWYGHPARASDGAASLTAAGGIGGLLATFDAGSPGTTGDDVSYIFCYDAHGNVGQLVDLSAQTLSAAALLGRYEYDAHGNVTGPDDNQNGDWLEEAGPQAAANAYRFSAKPFDPDMGMGNWGYRWYDPRTGRWVSRDPIGERGGRNLLAYAKDSPIGLFDPLGLDTGVGSFTDDPASWFPQPRLIDEWHFQPGWGCLEVRLGPSQAYSRFPSASAFSAAFRLEGEGCVACCDGVRFIQIYFRTSTFSPFVPWGYTTDWWDDRVDNQWHPDRGRGIPWYPYGTSMGALATMGDEPVQEPYAGIRRYAMDFETCAMCAKGSAKGAIYGCVKWGHSFRFSPDTDDRSWWKKDLLSWNRYVNSDGSFGTFHRARSADGSLYPPLDPQSGPPVTRTICNQPPSDAMQNLLDRGFH